MIKRLLILLFLFSMFLQGNIFAEEATIEERLIGSTFKALAKAYVSVNDIKKLRKDGVDKIKSLDEEEFQVKYIRVYELVKEMPPQLKTQYGITPGKNKGEAINTVNSLDKTKLYSIINYMSDKAITNEFKLCLKKRKESPKSNIVAQINDFWHDLLQRFTPPKTEPAH